MTSAEGWSPPTLQDTEQKGPRRAWTCKDRSPVLRPGPAATAHGMGVLPRASSGLLLPGGGGLSPGRAAERSGQCCTGSLPVPSLFRKDGCQAWSQSSRWLSFPLYLRRFPCGVGGGGYCRRGSWRLGLSVPAAGGSGQRRSKGCDSRTAESGNQTMVVASLHSSQTCPSWP